MSKMADMMEKMMAGMMKPEDMPVMMNAMTSPHASYISGAIVRVDGRRSWSA